MKVLFVVMLCFLSVSAMAARGPGRDRNPPPSDNPQWPPSSPQNGDCGGVRCDNTGDGPGPVNGSPFALTVNSKNISEGIAPQCGWYAQEDDNEGRALCYDENLEIRLCDEIECLP